MKFFYTVLLLGTTFQMLAQQPTPSTPVAQQADSAVQRRSLFYFEPMDGFQYYLMAEIFRSRLDVNITTDRSKADYIVSGTSTSDRNTAHEILFKVQQSRHYTSDILVRNAHTGAASYAEKIDSHYSAAGFQTVAIYFFGHWDKKNRLPRLPLGKAPVSTRFTLPASVTVQPAGDFHDQLIAAFPIKYTPVSVVEASGQATFDITWTADSHSATSLDKKLLNFHSFENAAIAVTDPRTETVVYAYAYGDPQSVHGERSSAESCAKHLGQFLHSEAQHRK